MPLNLIIFDRICIILSWFVIVCWDRHHGYGDWMYYVFLPLQPSDRLGQWNIWPTHRCSKRCEFFSQRLPFLVTSVTSDLELKAFRYFCGRPRFQVWSKIFELGHFGMYDYTAKLDVDAGSSASWQGRNQQFPLVAPNVETLKFFFVNGFKSATPTVDVSNT